MLNFFRRLKQLEEALLLLQDENLILFKRINQMSKEMDDKLQAAVAEARTVSESAVALINGFAERMQAALEQAQNDDDDAPIQEAIDSIKAQSGALAEAVSKNTPAEGGQNQPSGAVGPAAGSPVSGA